MLSLKRINKIYVLVDKMSLWYFLADMMKLHQYREPSFDCNRLRIPPWPGTRRPCPSPAGCSWASASLPTATSSWWWAGCSSDSRAASSRVCLDFFGGGEECGCDFDLSLFLSGLCPTYITEISPVQVRGGIGVCNQLAVTIGIFLSQVVQAKSRLLKNKSQLNSVGYHH